MSIVVRRDEWGVAHIRAPDEGGAFYGQGWVHVQDRWIQMDGDRRKAYGELAAVRGPSALASDQFWRPLALRSVVADEYRGLDKSTRTMVDAYTAGVNAALAASDREGAAPWRGEDCLAVFKARHLLMGVVERKLWWSRVARRAGMRALTDLVRMLSGDSLLIVPPGGRAWGPPANLDAVILPDPAVEGEQGSNSWVLAGSRTQGGRPLLAGDPHRGVELPNVYYPVHVAGGALDAIGLSFPGVPGMPHFGHNARVAWAITHTGADTQDLYVENAAQVLDARVEAIPVRGAGDASVVCERTTLGPVVARWDGDAVLVLRATALDAVPAQYRCLRDMLHADSVPALFAAQRGWVDPVNNLLAADTEGHIGYLMRGRVPLRPVENLLGPVPGDGPDHHWTGFIPFDAWPSVVDPEGDLVVTANNRVVGPDYPHRIAPVFAADHRARRIWSVLQERPRGWTADTMAAVHRDVRSCPAATFARWSRDLVPATPLEAVVLQRLVGWDGSLDAESALPLVYNTWRERVAKRALADVVGEDLAREAATGAHAGAVATLARLRARVVDLLPDLPAEAATDAFHEAVAQLGARWGPDLSRWRWDAAHRVQAAHPRAAGGSGPWPRLDVGLPGDGDTVRAASYGPGSFQVTGASVARYVFDVGAWDQSRWVVPGGTAEVGPTALNQLDAWAAGTLLPMWYSEDALKPHITTCWELGAPTGTGGAPMGNNPSSASPRFGTRPSPPG
ncbi:MAG: penicillin acylase family protein [Thermaerobacter sp.]|nr:penicillin acylase family protein [Thermaerobacter sp.]